MRDYGWGGLLVVAVLAAWWTARPRAERVGVHERRLIDLILIALGAGLVGARAWFCIVYWREVGTGADGAPLPLGEALLRAANLNAGGMVWYGGMVLASIAIIVAARLWRIPLLPLADALAPPTLIALAIGRIGCFINGCCWGAPCELPWAVAHDGHRVHPTQLYETIAAGALGGALLVWRRDRLGDGRVVGAASLGYAAWRFAVEFIRGDHRPWNLVELGPITLSASQLISLALAATGLWLLLRPRRASAAA